MIIGIPKETKAQEHRVGLLPGAAYRLARRGHWVLVENGARVGAVPLWGEAASFAGLHGRLREAVVEAALLD